MTWAETLLAIEGHAPLSDQEAHDQRIILQYVKAHGEKTLTRQDEIAHVTASAFIVNEGRDKALMAYHILRDAWAWAGGHADGEWDLCAVAQREAREETGLFAVPLSRRIARLDVLCMGPHMRSGQYVSGHLHLNAAYIFLADEGAMLTIKPAENSEIRWFGRDEIAPPTFSGEDARLYLDLLLRARAIK